MNSLIILANLSRVRVLKFQQAGDDPQEQSHLREDREAIREPLKPIREIVTDQQGRWSRSTTSGMGNGMSTGEEHNLELEEARRAVERIAGQIADVVADAGYPSWTLAATPPFAAQLRKALPAAVAAKLTGALAADLTKQPLDELEKRLLARA
jgi:protein required for attachment to host cells